MCTFPTLVQIYNILYLDSPLFPGSWPTIVLFTVALTEAHLGAVQIQSRANLLIPFFLFFFVAHPFSSNSPLLVSLSTHFLEDHCPSRWRCEIFNSLLLSGGQYTLADGPSPHRPQCMQISIQSRPGCFQYNTSAAGPVLIPLYQQPMHCFIQSNALSTMSTWTSGHITEAQKK